MSRLRAEVLRNFLSVNRGIKEGAGASRPVLARLGRLRAAVPRSTRAGCLPVFRRRVHDRCRAGAGATRAPSHLHQILDPALGAGSLRGRNLPVGLGEEGLRAGGRTPS